MVVQEQVVVEELPGWDRRCIVKFYLFNLCVGNGNGSFSSGVSWPAGFIVKEITGP